MKTLTDFERQQEQNEELALSGKEDPLNFVRIKVKSESSQPFEFIKPLILLLALTLSSAQPLFAYRDYFDEENRSEDGLTTAEEVRRLRNDLKEEREKSRRDQLVNDIESGKEPFSLQSREDQIYYLKKTHKV